jgi:hypothetical protein
MNPGCFLIGTGPSLNKIDVTRLAAYDTITFNRAYIAWPQWGFHPTWYACLDPVALEDNAADIRRLVAESGVRRFFLNENAVKFGIAASERVTLLRLQEDAPFSLDLAVVTDYGNVGASALQILAALGYRRVALVGVDARYSTLPGAEETGQDYIRMRHGQDPDHFLPAYLAGRRRIAKPDYARLLGQWPQVAAECEWVGLEVRNASPGSALTLFPFIDFAAALDWIGEGG